MYMSEKTKSIVAKKTRSSKQGPWWALKNTSGKRDVAMTLMILAFLFSLLLAGLGTLENVNLGERSFSFRAFDMGFATTVLVPLIGLYFGRRWTDTQHGLYDMQALHAGKKEEKDEETPPEQPE